MKCAQCQAENVADARFCAQCGQVLRQSQSSVTPDFSSMQTMDSNITTGPASTGEELAPGAVFAERYEIVARIGEGGSALVYRARDRSTAKDVALKVFRAGLSAQPGAAARVINAGAAARDIRHPNVVAIYDVGQVEGVPYLAMELLDGVSLRTWSNRQLSSGLDLPIDLVINIMRAILDAVTSIHLYKLITDLKMSSVMLLSDPTQSDVKLKIVDLGFMAAASPDTNSSNNLVFSITAPEAVTAPDSLKPSADIYSLSMIFYELLTGVLPSGQWEAPGAGRKDVPPQLDEAIRRGLSNNPRQRPQSAKEFRDLIEAAFKADPPKPPPSPDPIVKPETETTLWKIPKFLVPLAKWLKMPFTQVLMVLQTLLGWMQVLAFNSGSFGKRQAALSGGPDEVESKPKRKMRLVFRLFLGAIGLAAVVSGLVQMGVLNLDDFGDDPEQRIVEREQDIIPPGPIQPDPDPPRPPPLANPYAELNGRWMDDFGDTWRMTFNADGSFKGEASGGQFAGLGMVGAFDGRNFDFAVGSGNQTLGSARGIFDGGCHITYQTLDPYGSGMMINAQLHIRHKAGAECP